MKKKIYFKTYYDTSEQICGYVMAEEKSDYYTITERQYKNALKKRTVGGDAGIHFLADKKVYIVTKDGNIR